MKIDRTTAIVLVGAGTGSVAALVLSLAAISAATYDVPVGQEPPKITDWMQAWGSIGGVIAGLAAAGAAAFLLLHERQRAAEAERQLAEERAEAALNVPRAVVVSPAGFGGHGHPGDQYIDEVVLTIANYGGNAIRNVAAVAALPNEGPRIVLRRIPVIGPGGEHRIRERSRPAVPLPPGPWTLPEVPATVTVCFIDHTNQAWQTSSDGEISRTTVPYPAVEEALKFGAAASS
ncbi:hypothetical protein [Micromonospora sp. NPDC005305]|uniref:hypothetical protein n=1 Tax=Micromonospora sp. NPDC005305 TaxID=3156875 RepID=UPI0033B2FF9F